MGTAGREHRRRMLKRRGLVHPRKRLRHQHSAHRAVRHADQPNAVWAMDSRVGSGSATDALRPADHHRRIQPLPHLLQGRDGRGRQVAKDVWTALVRISASTECPGHSRGQRTTLGGSQGSSRDHQARGEDPEGWYRAGTHRAGQAAPERPAREIPSDAEAGDGPASRKTMHAQQRRFNAFQRETTRTDRTKPSQQRPRNTSMSAHDGSSLPASTNRSIRNGQRKRGPRGNVRFRGTQ